MLTPKQFLQSIENGSLGIELPNINDGKFPENSKRFLPKGSLSALVRRGQLMREKLGEP